MARRTDHQFIRELVMRDFPPLYPERKAMRTYLGKVKGEETAIKLATYLIRRSQWFVLTPLPDDEWEFTVKQENEVMLANWRPN